MARVTAELPPMLVDDSLVRDAVVRGAKAGADTELAVIVGEIKASPELPRDRGVLQRAIEATPAEDRGDVLVAYLLAGGEASAYAAVMDLGRRAGRPMSWKFLYFAPGQIGRKEAWRGGWVNRKLRDFVEEVALSLQAEAKARLARAGSGVTGRAKKERTALEREAQRGGTMDVFRRRACYLLARSIAATIRARGIVGRRFVEGRRDEIAARVRAAAMREIAVELRPFGWGQ